MWLFSIHITDRHHACLRALGSSELEAISASEWRITEPLTEWDPECAGEIDCYDAQCHISHIALLRCIAVPYGVYWHWRCP